MRMVIISSVIKRMSSFSCLIFLLLIFARNGKAITLESRKWEFNDQEETGG